MFEPRSSAFHKPTSSLAHAIDRSVPTVQRKSGLKQVIDTFQAHPGLRFLPVVDEANLPVGAIYETGIRRLLFNRFGHDLLANPGLTARIDDYLGTCPVREVDTPIAKLIGEFHGDSGFEGLVVTQNGAYAGVLTNRAILRLAASAESERSARRESQIARIEASAAAFRNLAQRATNDLATASTELSGLASEFLGSARGNEQRGRAMADAAHEASMGLQSIALQAAALATAGEQVRTQTIATNEAAATALRFSDAGSQRAEILSVTASEIGGVVELIQTISSQVRLLSLNARIEAARAGDAGATFGIVAEEIRQLAEQTQLAAGTITARTQAVDVAVSEALASHGAMRDAIATVASATAEIELAMTEHSRSTHAIADHVRDADDLGREVTGGLNAVRSDAAAVMHRTDRVDAMARAINSSALAMRNHVEEFLMELSAA